YKATPVQTDPLMSATIVALLITTGVVVVLGFLVNLTITRRLRHVAALTKRIEMGETDKRAIPTGHDEIYLIAVSINKMLDNIERLLLETRGQRDYLQAQVEKLVSEVSSIGEGDLRVQAQVTHDALGFLAESFNRMIAELGGLILRVKKYTQEVE